MHVGDRQEIPARAFVLAWATIDREANRQVAPGRRSALQKVMTADQSSFPARNHRAVRRIARSHIRSHRLFLARAQMSDRATARSSRNHPDRALPTTLATRAPIPEPSLLPIGGAVELHDRNL